MDCSVQALHLFTTTICVGYSTSHKCFVVVSNPDSKVHGANTGPIWGQQDPGGPHELCYLVSIYMYPSGILHWHWSNDTIVPMPTKQPWILWVIDHTNLLSPNDFTKKSNTRVCALYSTQSMGYVFNPEMVTSWYFVDMAIDAVLWAHQLPTGYT